MKLIEAVKEVLEEDPRTRTQEFLWSFFVKVLNKLGYRTYIEFKRGIPSPESIIKERRSILNRKNLYPEPLTKEEIEKHEHDYKMVTEVKERKGGEKHKGEFLRI